MSIHEQTMLFLSTILAGVGMAVIYDMFRIFRKMVKHSNTLVYLEDAAYWIIVSILMFYFMLSQNYGEIRIFTIIGAAIGAVLYIATLSPFIIKFSVIIIDFIIRIIATAVKIILAPIKLLVKIISLPIKFIKNLLKKPLQKLIICVKINVWKIIARIKRTKKIN